MNIYSSSIHQYHSLGETRCLLRNEWVNKLLYFYTMGYYNLKNELSNHKVTWRKFKCISLSERRLHKKKYILDDSSHMALEKKQNYGNSKKDHCLPGICGDGGGGR